MGAWQDKSKIMLSIEACKKILNNNGKNYNDNEVKQIREYLYFLAEIQDEKNKIENGQEKHECNNIL